MTDTPCFRIGHLKIIDHLILGIAGAQLEKNEETLRHSTLKTIAMNSWEQICDGLKQGDINGAFISSPLAMDLFSTGLDIRALMFTHRCGSMIIKKRTAKVRNISDFKGKIMLVPSELCVQTMLLHRLLSAAGLTFGTHDDTGADVVRETVNPYLMTEMLAADQDNDIAGFAVSEPFASQAIQKGLATKVCLSQSLWTNHPDSIFVLKTSFLKSCPEAVQEMINLFVQTSRFIKKTDNDTFFPMTHQFLGQNKAVTKLALLETEIPLDSSLLIPDIEALDRIQNYLADTMGVLPRKIDMNQLVDSSFILTALAEISH